MRWCAPMAVRQLWLFLTDADVAALVAHAERREPGVRASFGRYLRGDPGLLKRDPSRLERRESLPAERRLYLFHERHSADLVVHEQPEGPFAGWSQIDEERSDCLVLHLPESPPGPDGAPLELRPARLQANVVTWRGAEKIRKRPQFSSWAGKVIKALLEIHAPSAVPFMRLGADALARAQAGAVRLTYLYRPIGHAPVQRASGQSPLPVPPSAITEENHALDDEAAEEQAAAGLVSLQRRGTPAALETPLPTSSLQPASPGLASPSQPSPAPALQKGPSPGLASPSQPAPAESPPSPASAAAPADGPAAGSAGGPPT